MHNYSPRSLKPGLAEGQSQVSRAGALSQGSKCLSKGSVSGLIAFSKGIPNRLVVSKLGRLLQFESNGSVLIVNFDFGSQSGCLGHWLDIHQGIDPPFRFTKYLQMVGKNVHQLNVRASFSPLETGRVFSLLDHCRIHFDYILVQLGNDLPIAFLLDFLCFLDRSFLLIQATTKDLYLRDLILRELRVKARSEGIRLKTIICREKGEDHNNALLKKLGDSVHSFIHGCPTSEVASRIHTWSNRDFHDDIGRLAREISHRRIGLVLSSGGARGLSHIGVIQVLEENGIDVDIVAGCSMGSYVGAVWAYGYDGIFMEQLAREVEHRWGLLELLDPHLLPRRGFIKGAKIRHRLKRSIGDIHFSELPRPLRVVATNHASLERVVFSSGEVAEAVHASSAIPGACVPVSINGELFMDGGICDPLPVDVLKEMGIERIIAVNTIPTPSYLKCGEEMRREHNAVNGRHAKRLSEILNTYLNYFAPGNILDTIFRSFHGAQIRVAEQSCKGADLVLRPLCWDGRWHDFRNPVKYINIGRREAEEHLDEIKALVNRKELQHEKQAIRHPVANI